jgi:hypothetical protein
MPRWRAALIWVLLLGLVGLIMFPMFQQAKEGNGRNSCPSMLRQLVTAVRIYAVENDGFLPAEGWLDLTVPRTPKKVYECDVVRKAGKHYGYALNLDAAGRLLESLPESTVLLFETDALAPNVIANLAARKADRHPLGSMVAYADGKVKLIKKGESP